MSTQPIRSSDNKVRRYCVLLVLVSSIWLPMQAFAAPKYGNSLDWAPADAVFYSASLRLREQVEIVGHSKAWAKLTSLPSVQLAWQFAQLGLHQPGGPGDQLHQFLAQPENRELLDVVVDALSNEMFCYGDAHAADFTEIILRTIGALQYSSMIADLHSRGDDQLTVARILLNSLDLQRDRLAAPGIVLGFKISNTQRVQSQLKRLEALVKPHLDSDPRFQGSLKRTTIGGDEYLTMELDGKMVPWHDVPWDRLVEKPNQYDELREAHELEAHHHPRRTRRLFAVFPRRLKRPASRFGHGQTSGRFAGTKAHCQVCRRAPGRYFVRQQIDAASGFEYQS